MPQTINQLDNVKATDKPVMAETLIEAILPLQDYVLTQSARNSRGTLWTFTIGQLKTQLNALVEHMNNYID